MEKRMTMRDYVLAIALGGFLAWLVSSFYEPFSDADRAEMLIDGTSGLPQDR